MGITQGNWVSIWKDHEGWWLYRNNGLYRISKRTAYKFFRSMKVVINDADKSELLWNAPPEVFVSWRYTYVREYLSWLKSCFAIVNNGGTVQTNWAGSQLDLAAWRKEFMSALNRRINLKVTPEPIGRKYDAMYQTDFRRDQHDIHNIVQRRIRVYQFRTPEVRRRFRHLLSSYSNI